MTSRGKRKPRYGFDEIVMPRRLPRIGTRRQADNAYSPEAHYSANVLPITRPGLSNAMLAWRRTTPQDYPEWSGFGRLREREWGHRRQPLPGESGEPTHA